DIDSRIRHEILPGSGELFVRDADRPDFRNITHEHLRHCQLHRAARAVADEAGIAFKREDDAGADGSESGQADAKGGAVHGATLSPARRTGKRKACQESLEFSAASQSPSSSPGWPFSTRER